VYQRSSSQDDILPGIPRNSPNTQFRYAVYNVRDSLSLFLSPLTHTHTHTHIYIYIYISLKINCNITLVFTRVFPKGLLIPFPDQHFVIISPFPLLLCPTHPIVLRVAVFVRHETKYKNCKLFFHIMQKIIVDPLLIKVLLLNNTVVM